MKTISAVDTLALSIPERIQLVEDIWDTIAMQANAIELSAEEKKIVDERLDAFHKDPAAGSPWEEVVKKIRSR